MKYRGRFAPSPTGPLHMGSLVTAVASYLDARANDGSWMVRIEDLDPPREKAGATDRILSDLEAHGLNWDGEVILQSNRHSAYEVALSKLANDKKLFKCACSRKSLNTNGACAAGCAYRQNCLSGNLSIRFNVEDMSGIETKDFIVDKKMFFNSLIPTNFVVKRKDNLFSYQLAVVVDDAWQEVTHVIRGSDLVESTPKQILICSALRLPTPKYGHVPVISALSGRKLSKRTHAPSLDPTDAGENLRTALALLGQPAPRNRFNRPREILELATENWSRKDIPESQYPQ